MSEPVVLWSQNTGLLQEVGTAIETVFHGADPRIRSRTKMSQIQNTFKCLYKISKITDMGREDSCNMCRRK